MDLHDQSDVVQGSNYVSRKPGTITPSRNDQGKIMRCVASHPKLQNNLQRSFYLNIQGKKCMPSAKRIHIFTGWQYNSFNERVHQCQLSEPTYSVLTLYQPFPSDLNLELNRAIFNTKLSYFFYDFCLFVFCLCNKFLPTIMLLYTTRDDQQHH